MKKFIFRDNKTLIRFFQWLYFSDNEFYIVKLKGFNTFLVDGRYRATITPIWDKKRIVALYKRFIKKEKNNDGYE